MHATCLLHQPACLTVPSDTMWPRKQQPPACVLQIESKVKEIEALQLPVKADMSMLTGSRWTTVYTTSTGTAQNSIRQAVCQQHSREGCTVCKECASTEKQSSHACFEECGPAGTWARPECSSRLQSSARHSRAAHQNVTHKQSLQAVSYP
jgi:hypothetical protein